MPLSDKYQISLRGVTSVCVNSQVSHNLCEYAQKKIMQIIHANYVYFGNLLFRSYFFRVKHDVFWSIFLV